MVLTLLLSQDHNLLWVQQAPHQHTVYVESPAVLFLFILFIIGRDYLLEKNLLCRRNAV